MNRTKTRSPRTAALVATVLAAVSVAACKPGDLPRHRSGEPSEVAATSPAGTTTGDPTTARQQLGTLKVAVPGPMTGYSRARFGGGWKSQGNSCDTREIVLQKQGKNVVTDPKTCKITSGTWLSLYDGVTEHDPRRLDIDHLVPEAEAWRTGAANWPQDQREKFANDYSGELVAVTAHSNRSKGDGAPPEYMPVQQEHCDYATRWIAVKTQWHLTIASPEKNALTQMLSTCH